jgi:hypothetical protein
MKTIIKITICCCTILLFAIPSITNAQTDLNPMYFHHDDTLYIRAHDNHKYFQEYINYNGKTYMYYNKTYNNKSKDLYFYEIQFDNSGKISKKNTLAHKGNDFSDDLYFEKDINMNSAFFGVDNYLFVVVQNKKHNKNQMYRLNLSTNVLDIVDLDNNGNYDRYFTAVCSGYDVMLFPRATAELYTFNKSENNLNISDSFTYRCDGSAECTATSGIAVKSPEDDTTNLACVSIKNPSTGYLQIYSFNFNNFKDYKYDTQVFFPGKACKLVKGRSQALNQTGPSNNDGSFYISCFYTENDEYKDNKKKPYYKRCPVKYREVSFSNWQHYFTASDEKGNINLPSDDYYAKSGDDALLDIVENYIPVDISSTMSGSDGYQKQNILVSCDKKNETNFSVFSSDFYVINEAANVVASNMMEYQDEQWKKTWTLLGIVDGAPPCALDWDIWEEMHEYTGEVPPTELEWEIEAEQSSSTSIETETSWTLGYDLKGSIPIGEPLELSLGTTAEGAWINKELNETIKTKSIELTIPITLTEENQELARWYWLVPDITRYPYSTFDWSDSDFKHPINNTIDYAFITTNYYLKPEAPPLANAPHYISSPNDSNMYDWVARGSTMNDTTIGYYAFYNDLSSAGSAYYNSIDDGTSCKVTSETEQSTETTNTDKNSFSISTGIEIPLIFSFEVESSYEYEYTTSNKVTTTFKQSLQVNLSNLKPGNSSAIYPENYYVFPYLFTADKNQDWWYFDNPELMGYKPWYLAYTVSLNADKSNELLQLQSPAEDEVFYIDEPIDFSWIDDLQQTKLLISDQPTNALQSIVYRGDLKSSSTDKVSGLAAGTYYWRVAGISKDGEPVWSEFRKLMIVERDFLDDNSLNYELKSPFVLPAKVYPNPSYAQDVSVTYEVKDEAAPVQFILYDFSGVKFWESVIAPQKQGIHNKIIRTDNLGTHFAILRIVNGNYSSIQKIIVSQ